MRGLLIYGQCNFRVRPSKKPHRQKGVTTLDVNLRDSDGGEAVFRLRQAVREDLLRLGLLREEKSGGRSRLRLEDENLPLFLPMLSRFDVRLVPVKREGCPLVFCTGLVKPGEKAASGEGSFNRTIPGGGQGESAVIAAIGCVGELSERLSLWSLGNSDNRVFQKVDEQPEVDFAGLLGLSESQSRKTARELGIKSKGENADKPDWEALSDRRIALRRLTDGQFATCPGFGVLFQEFEQSTGRRLSYASSVGCAVWQTLEGARERAMLELVERDAVAQAWYNRLGITSLNRSVLDEILDPELLEYLEQQSRSFGVFAVETDLPVQVVMAISHDGSGHLAAFGSAAGWEISAAVKGAIREMLQSENALTLMDRSYPVTSKGKTPRQLAYARSRSIFEDLPLPEVQEAVRGELERSFSFDRLLQSCADRDIEIWEFDATRQDLAIPCIKLLSPQLCGWEPRFGKKRLFQGVVERGLRSSPADEAEFAARPFPF